jgi:enoyl-CoA hydratase/carnithine racemase
VTGGALRARSLAGVDILTLDSTGNANALSLDMLAELIDRLGESAAGDGRALLLEHTGRVFCSGVDMKERARLAKGDDRHSALFTELLCALWNFPRPLLCHVDGAVRGGGMGILACADIVVCSAASHFAYSEVRVGVAAALVTAVTLPKVTAGALSPWLLTGERFGAAEALRLGLVAAVADGPAEQALAGELAGLRRGAPHAVAVTKSLIRQFGDIDIRARLEQMGQLSAELFAGEEAREGMAAFAERREPAWSVVI